MQKKERTGGKGKERRKTEEVRKEGGEEVCV